MGNNTPKDHIWGCQRWGLSALSSSLGSAWSCLCCCSTVFSVFSVCLCFLLWFPFCPSLLLLSPLFSSGFGLLSPTEGGGEAAGASSCRVGTAGTRACVLLVWLGACNRYELAWGNCFVSLEQFIWFLKCSLYRVISQALSEPLVTSVLSEFQGYLLVSFVISILFFGLLSTYAEV